MPPATFAQDLENKDCVLYMYLRCSSIYHVIEYGHYHFDACPTVQLYREHVDLNIYVNTSCIWSCIVDYHYTYALKSYKHNFYFAYKTSSVNFNHSQSFLCSMNKMFWTSLTEDKVYEAQLSNGNRPTSIVDKVDRPRKTLIH